jgi:hypothetical protein
MERYQVAVDLDRHLIWITLRGFWDMATFEAFAPEFESALLRLHRHGGCRYALVDGREFAVQPLEISEAFARQLRMLAPYAARRTANVVPAQLNRMQAQRSGEKLLARFFSDIAEAEAWLFADTEEGQPPSVARR